MEPSGTHTSAFQTQNGEEDCVDVQRRSRRSSIPGGWFLFRVISTMLISYFSIVVFRFRSIYASWIIWCRLEDSVLD